MKIIIKLLAAIALASAARVAAQENVAPLPPPAESPPLTPEVSFFYDQLAPHGQWFWLEPYGWVWTPNDVDTAWRPYTDGHWVYTDCGWTWVSEREWGWAPFHYGRWFLHDRERQQAEHRAFNEHVNRQNQIFENRRAGPSASGAVGSFVATIRPRYSERAIATGK
jgi:Family of unknown function (DUF6600)